MDDKLETEMDCFDALSMNIKRANGIANLGLAATNLPDEVNNSFWAVAEFLGRAEAALDALQAMRDKENSVLSDATKLQ
jgi:hypothetical protein